MTKKKFFDIILLSIKKKNEKNERQEMKTKAFYDNNRLVFVIEDCSEEIKESLFTLLQPEVVEDTDAQETQFTSPAPQQTQQPQQQELDDIDRALIAMQQGQPNSTTDKAFKYISKLFQNGQLPENKGNVRPLLNSYVGNRFKGKNPDELVPKLTSAHCVGFVNTFDLVFAKIWEQFSDLNPAEFSSYDLATQQSVVKAGIEQCIKIGEILDKKK